MLLKTILAASLVSGAALFEPSTGIYFGAWLNTTKQENGLPYDTPVAFNQRMGVSASFFQLAEIFPLNFNNPPPTELIDATNTNAFLYLTVYPTKLDGVRDSDINDLVYQIAGFNDKGRRVFLRFAPEMNGNWFIYGQQPTKFIALWKRIFTAINTNSISSGKTAMIWAPSIGYGYPYPGGQYANNNTADPQFKELDSNGDGIFNYKDDPYSAYWPGDQFVDWVGLSTYYFGVTFPWIDNVLPPSTHFSDIITGTNGYGGVNFYDIYSNKAGKPLFVSESGASFHQYFLANQTAILAAGPGELSIKQSYWKQYITNSQLQLQFPLIKAICLFEFVKDEELTMRDFQVTFNATLSDFLSDFNGVKGNYIFASLGGAKSIPGVKNTGHTSLISKLLAVSVVLYLYMG